MYQVQLEESLFPAVTEPPLLRRTIADLLEAQARDRGEAPALREIRGDGSAGRAWTYGELLADSRRLARALASRHPKGARIAVFAHNLPEWVLLELASALAGLVLVTVNPSFGARELKYVLGQSRAEAIYFAPVVRGTPLGPVVEAACADLPAVTHRIEITDHDALFAGEDDGEARTSDPLDVVQIQYTSGTTGFPKGALLHQHGLIEDNLAALERWGMEPDEKVVCVMPLFHTAGCALIVLGTFAKGGCVLLLPGYEPAMLAKVIEEQRPTCFMGVPTMIVGLIDEVERSGRDASSIRRIMSGGAMVAPELVAKARKVLGAPIQIIYGQTESSPGITLTWPGDSDAALSGTIGQPLPHMDVAILDPEGKPCPIGVQGEICCRGFHVMEGYNDNPEATAAAIDSAGWLHTGDLGTMDARGYLKITGRLKDMIIRGGENLFPAEIENAVLEHEAVLEAAVVGIPDERWGEVVACFMRCREGARPGAAELKAFMRERLSPQKTPAFWIHVEAWPLTGSGKIQRFALRDAFLKGEHRPEA